MQTTVTRNGNPVDDDEASRFRLADESLRKSFSGLDVDDVEPEVRRSLDELGVEVPPATARAYAQHVADRADFTLDLD